MTRGHLETVEEENAPIVAQEVEVYQGQGVDQEKEEIDTIIEIGG